MFLLSLLLFFGSSAALAACDELQQTEAARVAEQASAATDSFDRVLLLKRSLKVCPEFAVWLALGKTELELDSPIDAVYALENARDFYSADANNTRSSNEVLRQAIANSWLAESYHRDNELALSVVALQEATRGFESLGQAIPGRLIELQAEMDDALANADSSVIARSLNLQHSRASRGIGVRPKIRVQVEAEETQEETAELLAAYSGEDKPLAQAGSSVSATALISQELAVAQTSSSTESRLNIPVLFEFDSDQLSTASAKTVAQLGAAIEALRLAEKDSVLIIGHTDSQGNESYNLSLSQRRAESVLQKIRQITDTTAEFVASGQGEAALRYGGKGNDDHRRNRRVELVIRR